MPVQSIIRSSLFSMIKLQVLTPRHSQTKVPQQLSQGRQSVTDVSLQHAETDSEGAQVAAQRGQHEPLLPGRFSGPLPSSCPCLAIFYLTKPSPGMLFLQTVTQRKTEGMGVLSLYNVTATLSELLLHLKVLRELSKTLSFHSIALLFLVSHAFGLRSLYMAKMY